MLDSEDVDTAAPTRAKALFAAGGSAPLAHEAEGTASEAADPCPSLSRNVQMVTALEGKLGSRSSSAPDWISSHCCWLPMKAASASAMIWGLFASSASISSMMWRFMAAISFSARLSLACRVCQAVSSTLGVRFRARARYESRSKCTLFLCLISSSISGTFSNSAAQGPSTSSSAVLRKAILSSRWLCCHAVQSGVPQLVDMRWAMVATTSLASLSATALATCWRRAP
mmetsp:Transcript_1802/g.7902  ORF Transcript_1802/g.7902 Transcript_1802/m.7902 type:complete len:228 (-) Transcript_1802:104-787(-)